MTYSSQLDLHIIFTRMEFISKWCKENDIKYTISYKDMIISFGSAADLMLYELKWN